jgi:HEPN domain-containing protein
MTDFTKTKISFALALLGTLFALHSFLDRFENVGFDYLGFDLKVFYVYALLAGLLAFTVYCYALSLVSERVHGLMERLGNLSYALAVIVLPLFGGLYLAHWLSERFEQSHLAWAAPGVALGVGLAWLVASQIAAWLFRGRLGQEDRTAKIRQWAEQEIASLNRAREMFESEHYDLSVIEAWRAIEARLRRALLARGIRTSADTPQALIDAAVRAKLVREPSLTLLQELRKQWNVAVSFEPLTRPAAESALNAARIILSTIALGDADSGTKPTM